METQIANCSVTAVKIKIEHCLICNKVSSYCDKRDTYTKLLIHHLVPPKEWSTPGNCKIFDFCVNCRAILDNLLTLEEQLMSINTSIREKIGLIKISMLKCPPCGNIYLETFRGISVRDHRPRVRMDKKNVLMESTQKMKALENGRWKPGGFRTPKSENPFPFISNSFSINKPFLEKQSHSSSSGHGNGIIKQNIKVEPDNYNVNVQPSTSFKKSFSPEIIDVKDSMENCHYNMEDVLKFEPWAENERRDEDPLMSKIAVNSNNPQVQSRKGGCAKPKLNQPQLIIVAIKNSVNGNKQSTIQQIVDWITAHFPYFQGKRQQLNRSISTRLCTLSCFKSTTTEMSGRGWVVVDKNVTNYNKVIESLREVSPECLANPDKWERIVDNVLPPTSSEYKPVLFPPPLDLPRPIDNTFSSLSPALTPKGWAKPKLSNPQLVLLAIKNNEFGCTYSTTLQIIQFILDNFPYYTAKSKKMKINASIRSIIGKLSCLKRAFQDGRGKTKYIKWTVSDQADLKNLANALRKIDRKSMARPESLGKMIDNVLTGSTLSATASKFYPKEIAYSNESLSNENGESDVKNGAISNYNSKSNKEIDGWAKPQLRQVQLGIIAIKNNIEGNMCSSINEIVEFLVDNFPYYRCHGDKLRRSMVTVLCTRGCFKRSRIHRGRLGRAGGWLVEDTTLDDLNEIVADLRNSPSNCFAWPERLEEMCTNVLMESTSNYSPTMESNGGDEEIFPDMKMMDEEEETLVSDCLQVEIEQDDEGEGHENMSTNDIQMEMDAEPQEQERPWPVPPFSFSQMTFLALASNHDRHLTTEEIIDFIRVTFPHYNYVANEFNITSEVGISLSSFRYFKPNFELVAGKSVFTWSIDYAVEEVGNIRHEIETIVDESAASIYLAMSNPDDLHVIIHNAFENNMNFQMTMNHYQYNPPVLLNQMPVKIEDDFLNH